MLMRCGSDVNSRVQPLQQSIRQSNQIVEDNVNGRLSGSPDLIESSNFYYNSDGTLQKIIVLNDTGNSGVVLKKVEFEYHSDYVYARTYRLGASELNVSFFFNNKKQITKLLDDAGNGLRFTYTNDLLTSFRDSSGVAILDYINFEYDGNNNLLKYELSINGSPPVGRAELTYGSDTIIPDLDTRFFNKGVNFIYLGGLNVIRKCGLNYGIDNRNVLLKRVETNLMTNTTIDTYDFGYIYDDQNRIVKRNIRRSGEDTLFYRYKY